MNIQSCMCMAERDESTCMRAAASSLPGDSFSVTASPAYGTKTRNTEGPSQRFLSKGKHNPGRRCFPT